MIFCFIDLRFSLSALIFGFFSTAEFTKKNKLFSLSKNTQINIREFLAKLGLLEVITFTFISENKVIPISELNSSLKLENPIFSDIANIYDFCVELVN